MNENQADSPVPPARNTSRVTVWRGSVYAAPSGYVTMGPNRFGEMIASNGLDVRVMERLGSVLDDGEG